MKKKILILGVMGHIGYALSIYLNRKNFQVIGTYNKFRNLSLIKNLKKNNIRILQCNFAEKKGLNKIFKKYKIDNCINCAAISHDSVAKKIPSKAIDANCYGVANLIDFQKKFKFKLINISTGSVFQEIKSSKHKIDETITPTPKSVYASTKRVGELLIHNNHEIDKKSCNLRVSWVYGPPIILTKFNAQRGPIAFILSELFFKNKKKLNFKSGADFQASFTYIDDVCEVIFKMIKLKKFNFSLYNFGSGKNYLLKDIIKFINKNYKPKKIVAGKGYIPWSNDSIIRGPIVSLKHRNFFKPTTNIYKGVKKYISFIKGNNHA